MGEIGLTLVSPSSVCNTTSTQERKNLFRSSADLTFAAVPDTPGRRFSGRKSQLKGGKGGCPTPFSGHLHDKQPFAPPMRVNRVRCDVPDALVCLNRVFGSLA